MAKEELISVIKPACTERIEHGVGFGDQDILNYYYSDWPKQMELHLSELYNCLSSYVEVISKDYGFNNISIIHYIGVRKIWEYSFNEIISEIMKLIRMRQWASLFALFLYLYYLR